MAGGEVGMVEKKQGRFAFPERDPVTGLNIDNVLEAGRQNTNKGYKQSQLFLFLFYFLIHLNNDLTVHDASSNDSCTLRARQLHPDY